MFSAAQTWTPGWLRQSWEFQRRWSLSTSGCPLCKRSPSIFLADQVEKPVNQRFYNYDKYMRINRWKPGVSLTQASWVLPPGCSLTAHHHRPICHCWLWHWRLPLSLLKLKILISDCYSQVWLVHPLRRLICSNAHSLETIFKPTADKTFPFVRRTKQVSLIGIHP